MWMVLTGTRGKWGYLCAFLKVCVGMREGDTQITSYICIILETFKHAVTFMLI